MPRLEPCTNCPWRVGVDAWAIGRDDDSGIPPLHRTQMEALARSQGQGLAAQVMACHLSHRGDGELPPADRLCVGFALSAEGGDNLNLRVLALRGMVDLCGLRCFAPLHPDFAAMLAANPAREVK